MSELWEKVELTEALIETYTAGLVPSRDELERAKQLNINVKKIKKVCHANTNR